MSIQSGIGGIVNTLSKSFKKEKPATKGYDMKKMKTARENAKKSISAKLSQKITSRKRGKI